MYRITAVHVQDFKRIRDVEIRPASDASVILIGGKNAQGKTSLMDALTTAIGGKREQPRDAVRHGETVAGIVLELDNGTDPLVVHKKIRPDGETSLEVRGKDGPLRSPQAVLDRIVGGRFLDPLAFVGLPPLEQRATLLKLIDSDGQLAKLEEKRERVYAHRTEVARDRKKAEGELARLPEIAAIPDPIDVAALNEEVRALADKQRRGDGLGNARDAADREAAIANDRLVAHLKAIAEVERQLISLRGKLPELDEEAKARVAAAEVARIKVAEVVSEWTALAPRRAALDADLARADAHNRDVYASQAAAKRRTEAAAVVDQLAGQWDEQTDMLQKIERRKLGILEASKLPVEGLGVDAAGVTLNGVPFAQASGAEKLRVALGLAIAASPGLCDVWIRDGALLDDESLALVGRHAEETDHRVWIERVSDRDVGAIVISDGTVVA